MRVSHVNLVSVVCNFIFSSLTVNHFIWYYFFVPLQVHLLIVKFFLLLHIPLRLSCSFPSLGTCIPEGTKPSYLLEMYQVCIPCHAEEEIELVKVDFFDYGCKGSIVSLDSIALVKNVTVCSSSIMDCD